MAGLVGKLRSIALYLEDNLEVLEACVEEVLSDIEEDIDSLEERISQAVCEAKETAEKEEKEDEAE